MAIDGVGGVNSSTGTNAVSRQTLASNFETFLTLLTTQLQHQNPLEPLDTNQFTQQLVSFAGVEQQLRTNDNLESLVKLSKIAHNATALSFVGLNVTAEGATTELRDGLAVWYLSSPKPVQAQISIQDANGSTVFTETKTLDAAIQPYQWNGRTSTGSIAPAGRLQDRRLGEGRQRSDGGDRHKLQRHRRSSRRVRRGAAAVDWRDVDHTRSSPLGAAADRTAAGEFRRPRQFAES